MKYRAAAVGFAVLFVFVFGAAVAWRCLLAPNHTGHVVRSDDYVLSGPYTHDNLTVYLIHGPETLDGRAILTLPEALEQNKVVVNETGEVNQLTVENLSGEEVFVLSGDVVKGGKQDRTLPYDALIGPRSGQVSVDSFCVEQGRWSKRGDEESGHFAMARINVGNVRALKEAQASVEPERDGRSGEKQQKVWRSVEQTQERLSKKLGESVQADESKSSLQLTLERPLAQELGAAPQLRAALT